MSNALNRDIASALAAAREFLEQSAIPVPQSAEGWYGFPVYRGKGRVTECGASAAISALCQLGTSSPISERRLNSAKAWLLSRQQDGAWQAGGLPWAEVTALVLTDLRSVGLDDCVITAALGYLKDCRKDGFFASHPDSLDRPHIFTTYACVRAIRAFGHLEQPQDIAGWLDGARTPSGHWGFSFRALEDSPVATAYALATLAECLGGWDAVRRQYPDCTRWLVGETARLQAFEEETVITPGADADADGPTIRRLRIGHYARVDVGRALMAMGYETDVIRMARQVLDEQHDGGWGPNKEVLTMWATQHAALFLQDVRASVLPHASWLQVLGARVRQLPTWAVTVGLGAVLGALMVLALVLPSLRTEILSTLFLTIGALVFKKVLEHVR